MGNSNCAAQAASCSGDSPPCGYTPLSVSIQKREETIMELPQLTDMNILEYERRIKMYAHPENKGFINEHQLMEAFRGTGVFQHLANPSSVKTQFFLCPYFANYKTGSFLKVEKTRSMRNQSAKSIQLRQLKSSGSLFLSVVDNYLCEIEEQGLAKKNPENGLDPEFNWISISALILYGIVKCSGSDIENAEVFYRVIQPEMHERILVVDKDIRSAIFFMTNLSTILHLMLKNMFKVAKTRTGTDNKPRDFEMESYAQKMDQYEVVFDGIIEQFNADMFGPFANSVSSEEFVESMAREGWKYFDIQNLNELFALTYSEKIESGEMEELAKIDEQSEHDEDPFFEGGQQPTEDQEEPTKATTLGEKDPFIS